MGSTAFQYYLPITIGHGVDQSLTWINTWKCNLFIFQIANDSGIVVPTNTWNDIVSSFPPVVRRQVPPAANDWYNSKFTIPAWTWQATNSFPEPGWVATYQYTSRAVSGGAHIGILAHYTTKIIRSAQVIHS